MNIHLSALEARIIGCLIEKAITTPDQYPLSLNSLTNACNQKSNRDPVLDLDERTVQETVDGLAKKHLVLEKSGFGSRVPKYQHRFCNTGFGTLEFSPQETAILCELLLRGPQTPGELRTRASRMAEIARGQRDRNGARRIWLRVRTGLSSFTWRVSRAGATPAMHIFSAARRMPAAAGRRSDRESEPKRDRQRRAEARPTLETRWRSSAELEQLNGQRAAG